MKKTDSTIKTQDLNELPFTPMAVLGLQFCTNKDPIKEGTMGHLDLVWLDYD